jgi:hypothetical protein
MVLVLVVVVISVFITVMLASPLGVYAPPNPSPGQSLGGPLADVDAGG